VKPRLLVATTCCWYPTARLVMALANAGFGVTAVCPFRHPLRWTHAVREAHPYHFIAPLISFRRAIISTKPDFIIPTDDLAVQHLHEIHDQERRNGNAGGMICALIERSLGAPEGFPLVYARARFMELAQEEGVRVPKTQRIRNIDDLRQWIAQAGFPTVLKADGSSGGFGVRIAHTTEEAESAFRVLEAPPNMLRAAKWALIDQNARLIWPSLLRRRSAVNAQVFVPGDEATSTTVCWKGAVLATLHFEVVRRAYSAGPATVVRLIEDAEMSSAVERVVRRLNLSGVHGFDFIREECTGSAHLIEINPRATQVGHLTLGPGRDLPAALYAAVSGRDLQAAPKITENDTIALFPHELRRDPMSTFLRSAYHDVPWEEPSLVADCLRKRRRQGGYHSERNWIDTFSTARLPRT
jgi:ATP-grasp domain